MKHVEKIREAYDDWAPSYDAFMDARKRTFAKRVLLDRVRNEFSGRILDVGTGTGMVAVDLVKTDGVNEVYAVDLSGKMLEAARKSAGRENVEINFLRADARNLLFADKVFDVVVSSVALGWISDKEQVMAEMARVAKDTGTIVILEEESPKSTGLLADAKGVLFDSLKGLESYYGVGDYVAAMGRLGFGLVRNERAPMGTNQNFVALIFRRQIAFPTPVEEFGD